MQQEQELKKQNARLDRIEKALDSLHNVSKTVGDELEEQITLIERLEDETDRAHETTRRLQKNMRTHTMEGERINNNLLNIVIVLVFVFLCLLVLYFRRK